MEQNPPYTTPLDHPTPLISNTFSPVSGLLKKSWDKTQKHLLQLFLLTILAVVIGLVGVLAISLLIVLFQTWLAGTVGNVLTAVVIIIGVIAGVGLMIGLNIGLIMIMAETDSNLSVIALLKKATRKSWTFFFVSLLVGLLVAGGGVILLIPGILFSLLLSFTVYFVVLDQASPLEAMRKSVFITSKNFGTLFVRLLVLFGLGFIGGLIINLITSQSGNLVGSVISFIFNLVFGWFSIGYMLSLFQEAKKMAGEGRGKLMWMAVVAIVGWLLIVGGGYLIFRTANNNPTTNNTRTIPFNNSLLDLNTGNDKILATPPASLRSASASASVRPTATPRASSTPKASAATSSANR